MKADQQVTGYKRELPECAVVKHLKWLTLEEIMDENHFQKFPLDSGTAASRQQSSRANSESNMNWTYLVAGLAMTALITYGVVKYRNQ